MFISILISRTLFLNLCDKFEVKEINVSSNEKNLLACFLIFHTERHELFKDFLSLIIMDNTNLPEKKLQFARKLW